MASRVPLTVRDLFFQDPFFESKWSDFDKIRQDMMKEQQDFWSKVSAGSGHSSLPPPADLAPSSGSGSLLSPMVMPKRWMLPRFLSRDDSEKLFPSDFFSALGRPSGFADDQVLKMKDGDDGFELSLDTHEFRPDELKVTVEDGVLKVDAKHEEKGDGKFVSRQFSRSFTLPKGVEAAKVRSDLSSDGVLMITAPKAAAPAIEKK